MSYEVERSAAWSIRQGPDKPGHGCDLPPWLADVDALDPPTERVRADRVRERTTDVHAGPPVGQPPPRHVPADVNIDLSARPCWSHRHHRADGATSRANDQDRTELVSRVPGP